MAYVYARDLRRECLTDAFMGKGFEDAFYKSLKHGTDLIVGEYADKWEEC